MVKKMSVLFLMGLLPMSFAVHADPFEKEYLEIEDQLDREVSAKLIGGNGEGGVDTVNIIGSIEERDRRGREGRDRDRDGGWDGDRDRDRDGGWDRDGRRRDRDRDRDRWEPRPRPRPDDRNEVVCRAQDRRGNIYEAIGYIPQRVQERAMQICFTRARLCMERGCYVRNR